MPAPTIRDHLKCMPGWLWANQHICGCAKAIPLYPFIVRYGLDVTLPEVRLRMRCETCHNVPSSLSLATSGRNEEYRLPPFNRVPLSLRPYARIDPVYLPAPLRASAWRA